MIKLSYDFHIHSCLSPCADDESTPNNIVNIAFLNGLSAIALTDHNSCRNCAATMEVAAFRGLLFLPGMELTTEEEAHIICLFPDLTAALDFEKYVDSRRIVIKNRAEIYGQQFIMDSGDNITGKEERLLTVACRISANDVSLLVRERGGIAYPAHIDRPDYSVISSLGFITPDMEFSAYEISGGCSPEREGELMAAHPYLNGYRRVSSSDAHIYWGINDAINFIEVKESSTKGIIEALRKGG